MKINPLNNPFHIIYLSISFLIMLDDILFPTAFSQYCYIIGSTFIMIYVLLIVSKIIQQKYINIISIIVLEVTASLLNSLTLKYYRMNGLIIHKLFEFWFYLPLMLGMFYISYHILHEPFLSSKFILVVISILAIWLRVLPHISFSYLVFGDTYYLYSTTLVQANLIDLANPTELSYFKAFSGYNYITAWPFMLWITFLVAKIGFPLEFFLGYFTPVFCGSTIPVLGYKISKKSLMRFSKIKM